MILKAIKTFLKILFTHKKIILIVAFLLLFFLVSSGSSAYLFLQLEKTKKELEKLKNNPDLLFQTENKIITGKLSKLIELPADEEPNIVTVTDVETLREQQPFFAKAQNGQKVVVYPKARKVILYDLTANKIIEVGPLIINTPIPTPLPTLPITPQLIPTPTTAKTARIFLLNGTSVTGLTGKIEPLLKDIPSYQIVDKDNAQKRDYKKTLVIDLNGNKSEEATNIAKIIGGEVSAMPSEEKRPDNTDILVIVAEDKK